MEIALQTYEGALVLVSHDRHLLRNTVEELLLVRDGAVEEYRDDLMDYERWLLSSYKAAPRNDTRSRDKSRREQRQQAATQRDKLRPLKKQLAQTETEMEEVALALDAAQEQLAGTELYEEAHRDTLAEVLKREGRLKQRATELDDAWLALQQQLDDLTP